MTGTHIKRPSPRLEPRRLGAMLFAHPLPTEADPAPRLKPLFIGMNHAKRMAARMDARDQLAVLATIGTGHVRQHLHHQQLVRQRHAAIHDREDAYAAGLRATPVTRDPGCDDPQAGGSVGAVPESAAGSDDPQRDDGTRPV